MSHDDPILDAVPAPGEPLKRDVHAENRAILEMDIGERVKLLEGKLSGRQRWNLTRRFRRLWRQLNRAHYNVLIRARADAQRECEDLLAQFDAADDEHKPEIRKLGWAAVRRGKAINARLADLQPLIDEFEEIANRLELDRTVREWEAEDAANRKAFYREARAYEQQILGVFRQSPRLHHRGLNRHGKEVTTIPIIAHKFITEDKMWFQILLSKQNPIMRALGKYQSGLPYGVDIASLSDEKTLENLSGACDRKVVVERGKRGETFYYVVSRLDSPDGLPRRVLYSKVMNYYPVEDHSLTPWPGGVTTDRRIVFFNLEEDPHVLIAGATKGGKSNLINAIIATFARMNAPSELRLILIDNKGGVEFTHWQRLPHLLMPMIKEPSQVVPALQRVHEIMRRRLVSFEAIGARNLPDYNRKVHDEDRLPRVVCIVDEMATLMGDAEVQNELQVVASQGRAVGVHLILCTQHVINDVVHSTIKVNMVLRVAAQMPSDSASRVILDTGTAALLPKVPGRMVFRSGSIETIAQTPLISDAEVGLAVKYANDQYARVESAELTAAEPIAPREKFSRTDMIQLALEQLDGKLSAQKMNNIVGNEVANRRKLQDMIDEVIALGEIDHCGALYKIKRVGRAYVLTPITQLITQNNHSTLLTSDPGDRVIEWEESP